MATTPDPPLVDVADLENRLQDDDLDSDFALELVLGASSVVRSHCRQLLHLVTDDVVPLFGNGQSTLLLPQLPVVEITGITMDGADLSIDRLQVDNNGGIVRWRRGFGPWTLESLVEFTYTHGYEPMHETIRAVTLNVAARAAENPGGGGAGEQLGDHQFTAAGGVTIGWGGIYLTGKEKEMLQPFRVRR